MQDIKKKTAIDVWDDCLGTIKDNINEQAYKTWFLPIKPISLNNSVLNIQVPSQFFYEWLEEHYINLLTKVIKKELGSNGRLEYSIIMDANSSSKNNPYSIKVPGHYRTAKENPAIDMPININKEKNTEIPNPFVVPGLKKINIESQLVDSYSFDNFIEGDCNRLARSAGYAVAENPGKTSFNPLFIYGDVGLGKTHLAHAIGLHVKNKFPDKIVLYVSTEQFTQQYIDAVKNNNYNDFVHFYQIIDVLIMDDIQFLVGKEKTQNVFFHIFNHMYQNGKQIILTSDKPPVDIKNIEKRLLSRFKWGLSADLQSPDLQTRIDILNKIIYNDGTTIPKDVVEYLAYSITSSVRELEGAYINIMAQSSLNKKEITLDLTRKMIGKYVRNIRQEISIDYIIKVVSEHFNITEEDIMSKSRKREVVQARQLVMYFSKNLTKNSLSAIGLQCGKKNHATVLYAIKTVEDQKEYDKKFREHMKEIERKLKG